METELRFALNRRLAAAAATAATHVGPAPRQPRAHRLRSIYFDTPDGRLAQALVALRVRSVDGRNPVQTIKAPGDDPFSRFEHEVALDSMQPSAQALPPQPARLATLVGDALGALVPVFETDFRRTARTVEPVAGLVVEIAIDRGRIVAGERSEPIAEMELELKGGTREAFWTWVRGWAEPSAPVLAHPSKHERGLRLAGRLPASPAPMRAATAATPAPGDDAEATMARTAAQAARTAVVDCIDHFLGNLEPIRLGTDPGGPHQFRVALRRLRAAIRFFGLEAVDPAWADIATRARGFADVAGRVRELDVFEADRLARLRAVVDDDVDLAALGEALDLRRQRERAALRAGAATWPVTGFVIDVMRAAEALARAPALAGPFAPFAGRRLIDFSRRALRRTRRAEDATGRHRLRIAIKNLRYAMQFAAHVLPPGVDARRWAARLARWQDAYGREQDVAVAREAAVAALEGSPVAPHAARHALALVDVYRAGRHDAGASAGPDPRSVGRRLRRLVRQLRAGALAARATEPDGPPRLHLGPEFRPGLREPENGSDPA